MIETYRCKPDEVIKHYEQALKISNDDHIYKQYSASLRRLGLWTKGKLVAKRFSQHYPDMLDAWHDVAVNNFWAGNLSVSIAAFQRLIKLHPDNETLAMHLSIAELAHQINLRNNVNEEKTSEAIDFACNFLNKKGLKLMHFSPKPQQDELDAWVTYRFFVEPSDKLKGLNFEFSKESTKRFIEDDSAFNGIVISFEPNNVSHT
jgi:tetratricopeptide (TPR) repeat protein